MNWGVQFAAALGTFLAVLAALFGDALRRALIPPKLTLSLLNPQGSTTNADLTAPDGTQRRTVARYYHVQVVNHRRWSPATHVRVSLRRVEQPAADGRFMPTWVGNVPLQWRFQEFEPSTTPTIGTPMAVDLCSVVKDKWLELHPLFIPTNLDTRFRERTDLILVLQAVSNEADSDTMRVRIAWDGKWSDDSTEMARHLTVQILQDASPGT